MLKNLGTPELLIILALILLFFGGKKIPEFIKGIGEAIKEFKRGSSESKNDDQ